MDFEQRLNLRHLRAFVAVAQHLSIRQGAEAVHLSQPAATQAVRRLEAALGAALFDRVGGRLKLTEAGSAYAARVRQALEELESGIALASRGVPGRGRQPRDVLASLTTTQLRAFLAVGELNNLTLAARTIETSQPAVHRSIREIESVLDAVLFERTSHGIALSRNGKALWQKVRIACSSLAQGGAEVRDHRGLHDGVITIGCMPLIRNFVLPEAINRFSRLFPAVTVRVIDAPYSDLIHGLRHGEIDFVAGALRPSLQFGDIRQEALFQALLCVAARHDHPLARKRRLQARDLAAYPWVLPPRGTPTRERFDRFVNEQRLAPPSGLIESSSQVLIRGLLMGSDRLTLISTHQVEIEVRLGLLARLRFSVSDWRRDIGLTLRLGWRPTLTQQEFLRVLASVSSNAGEGVPAWASRSPG